MDEKILEVFECYKDMVFRLALSYTKCIADAEDISQTVFIKLYENYGKIEQGKEKTWLLTVTANQSKNLLKSFWRKKTEPLEDIYTFEYPEQSSVFVYVMGLKPKYRVVIYLHYYEGYDSNEIARILGITQSASTTRLQRARRMLRTRLEEENNGEFVQAKYESGENVSGMCKENP